MWSIIEVTVAIICASVPALRPLLDSVLPKVWVASDIPATVPRPRTRTRTRRSSTYQMSTYGPYLRGNERNSLAFSGVDPSIGMTNYNSSAQPDHSAGGHDSSTSITRAAENMGANDSSVSITRPEPVAYPNESSISFARSDQIVGIEEKV